MPTDANFLKILHLVDAYNRGPGNPVSPFIAEHEGRLDAVAAQIGIPTPQLRQFLSEANALLPSDYLMG